jgi:hypothetical protein
MGQFFCSHGLTPFGLNLRQMGELFGRYRLATFSANRSKELPHFTIHFNLSHESIPITSILAHGRITASALSHGGNFEDKLGKGVYFCSSRMSESTDFSSVVFPPKVETKIQKLVKNTGLTRNEVIQGLVMAFFDKIDQPSENVPAFVLLVKTALRELGSGG